MTGSQPRDELARTHRVPLDSRWSLWRHVCLRGTGFPVGDVEPLTSDVLANATAELLVAEDELVGARNLAIACLESEPRSRPINRALKALRASRPLHPLPSVSGQEATLALERLMAATVRRQVATEEAKAVLGRENARIAGALKQIGREPRFREALTWQNRRAVHQSLASMLARPVEATDSKTRDKRRFVARAITRYAVKNDTIGFFGPVGWVAIEPASENSRVETQKELLAKRTVYFEHWCVDAIANALAKDPALRAIATPRRAPGVWVEGSKLIRPDGSRTELPTEFAALLAAVDGVRSASELAAADVRALADFDDDEVLDLLEELADKGLCIWTLEVPTATSHPERHLRDLLERTKGETRAATLAIVDRLEGLRSRLEAVAGDAVGLDAALTELDEFFEEVTGLAASRKGGETYAGRTLVYEDCLRRSDLVLGRDFIERLAAPLACVLTMARWFTHEIAVRYEERLRRLHAQLGGGVVDYSRFAAHLPPLFPGRAGDGIAGDVAAALDERWSRLVGLEDGNTRERRLTAELATAAVADAFQAPGPGWPSARHHSPDVMIAANGPDAVRRGDYQIVLGEIHVGFNTGTLPCLVKEHANPEMLVSARESDLPAPGVAPTWTRARNRADFYSISRHDFDLEVGGPSARPRSQVLEVGALVVVDENGVLVVRDRANAAVQFELIAFLEQHLIAESFPHFRLGGSASHAPRVLIGDVIIARERWSFRPAALDFARAETELDRLLGFRRFADTHGLPRRLFVKTPAEPKPFFLDRDSPLLVDIFIRSVRRAESVALSEMLPDVDQCWLPGPGSDRYASEFRLVAVDSVAWRGRGAVTSARDRSQQSG